MFRAIVIDDEIWALRGFMNLLDWEELGIRIIGGYQDEEEALDAIRRERPDIVITDVYLKNRKGNEILRILKEEKIPAETVLISAHRDFDAAADSMRYHTHAYILKPYRKEEVHEVFAALSEKMRQTRTEERQAPLAEGSHCYVLYTQKEIPSAVSEWVLRQNTDPEGGLFCELGVPKELSYTELVDRLKEGSQCGLSMERMDFLELDQMIRDARFSGKCGFFFCRDTSIADIQKYIVENIDKPLSLNDIAEHFYMSAAYLSFKYRKMTDMTITDFIHQVKMESAKRLIQNKVKLHEAARQTGFDNYNYFGRLFKRYTGQSPEKYAAGVNSGQ